MWTLLILLLLSSFHLVLSSCPITISELQLSTKNVRQEFIELKKHCNESVDLSAYTLALWRGGTGHGDGNSSLVHIIHFDETGWWKEMNATYLVIGFNVTVNSTDAEFVTFEEVDWKKNTDFYIDRGNLKTNALVLYANLSSEALQINTTLSNDTAHRANIVDLLFFYHSGSAHHIRSFLFPEYQVGPNRDGDGYYRLKDSRNDESKNTGSFAFCCNDSMVEAKWPMGYKWTEPTPGEENKCADALYCLDPAYKNFPRTVDRCNVAQVQNFFATTTVRPVTTAKPPGTTTAVPHKPSSLGLSVGIPIAVACVALMATAFVVIYRRRRYSALPADRTTWNLNCFNRPDDTDRLVLDSS